MTEWLNWTDYTYLKVAKILDLKCFHHKKNKKRRWGTEPRNQKLLRAGTLEKIPLLEPEPATERGERKLVSSPPALQFPANALTCKIFFRSHLVGAGKICFRVVSSVIQIQFSSVHLSHSVVSDSLWPHESQHARPPCPSQLLEFTQTYVHRVGDAINHLILCHPLPLLPPIPPSIRVFSNESALHKRWPKYWSFSFNISPSNEHPGLISFRMDWLDLLAVWGTLKNLFQHHSSKASIFWHSVFLKSNSHIHTWPLEKPFLWPDGPLLAK